LGLVESSCASTPWLLPARTANQGSGELKIGAASDGVFELPSGVACGWPAAAVTAGGRAAAGGDANQRPICKIGMQKRGLFANIWIATANRAPN
jgi:hypothetical protein